MSCAALLKQIESLNNEYISFLEDVCNIESPTNFKEGVDKLRTLLANKLCFSKNQNGNYNLMKKWIRISMI